MENRQCTACGSQNKSYNKFCTHCGTKLSDAHESGPRLVILDRTHPKVFHLDASRSTIGRDKTNTVVLPDSKVSKVHAEIKQEAGCYWIEDLGSKNGVFVNGRQIKLRKKLSDGNLVKLGTSIMRFELAGG